MRPFSTLLLVAAAAIVLAAQPCFAYYHPTAGRWVSRDPIRYGDGMSLYGYVWSRPTHATDPLGLNGLTMTGEPASAVTQRRLRHVIELDGGKPITDSKGDIVGERKCEKINCLGHATGEGDFIQPVNDRDSAGNFLTNTSFKDFMEAQGWKCRPMQKGDECTCKPKEERLILIFYENTATRPDGSPIDPYNDPWPGPAAPQDAPVPDWRKKGADFHGIKGPPGAEQGNWSEVMGAQDKQTGLKVDGSPSPNPAAQPRDMTSEEAQSKGEDAPRYCCCRCKPSGSSGSGRSGP